MTFRLNGQKYRITLNVALVASVCKDGEAELEDRVLATDAAVCHSHDFFDPKYGAKLAVTRAVKRAFRDDSQRAEIWAQIRDKVGKKGEDVFAQAAFESELEA